ncbi:MAG: hypothetical protein R3A45_07525 [Bdellovibrionota bacterium]
MVPEISPDRSVDTRNFLEPPKGFQQFNLISSNKKKPNNSTDNGDGDQKSQEEINQAQSKGAILLFRSSIKEKKPLIQYVTKFLTENEQLGPLESHGDRPYKITDLYHKSDEITFPKGADLGSYFFHNNTILQGNVNYLLALPEDKDNLSALGINKDSWDSIKTNVAQNCQSDIMGFELRSELAFDFGPTSLSDFDIGDHLLDAAFLDKDPILFDYLQPSVKDEIKGIFNYSLEKGSLVNHIMICPDNMPTVWLIRDDQSIKQESITEESGLLTIQFKDTVQRNFLKKIELSPVASLLDLAITGKKGSDVKVFTRDTYEEYIKVHLPLVPKIVTTFAEKKKNGTTASENSAAEEIANGDNNSSATSTNNPLLDDPAYADVQKEILNDPNRRRKTLSSTSAGNTTTPSHQPATTNTPTSSSPNVDIQAGNSDEYEDLKAKIATWNNGLRNDSNANPFFSTVLNKISHLFYEPDGQYLPMGSQHLVQDGNGFSSPLGKIWNGDLFKNDTEYSDAEVTTYCSNFPFIRELTFHTDIRPPKDAENKNYVPSLGKTLADAVIDQLWVDANPANSKYSSSQDKTDNSKEKPNKNARAAVEMITYGAFNVAPGDPLKNNQRMNMKVCVDPASGKYDIFWKSAGTEFTWKPGAQWKLRHAKFDKYVKDALAKTFTETDTPLIANPKPWRKASKAIHFLKNQHLNDVMALAQKAKDTSIYKTLSNRANQSPSQTKVVCSENIKKCFLIFQATFLRALNPAILALYINPPTNLLQKYKDRIQDTAPIPYSVIYGEMIQQMMDKYNNTPNGYHKSETTLYGALEIKLDELDQEHVPLPATFFSMDSIKNKVFDAVGLNKDKDGYVYFTGATAEMYLSLTAKDASNTNKTSQPVM